MIKNKYDNESISSLKGADRVRKRPGVIFGSDGIEGCEHSIFEILSNSIDESREGHGSLIMVTYYGDNSVEIENLANLYIKDGVLTQKNFSDAIHISSAVVANCDMILSWNFKHFVNVRTIGGVRTVNSKNWYKEISIVVPSMIVTNQKIGGSKNGK